MKKNKNIMYTVDYFIKKFEAIPEKKWCTGSYGDDDGKHCAFGHCRINTTMDILVKENNEATALSFILRNSQENGGVVSINDGLNEDYQQPTPKQRILAALYDIKKKQQPTEKIKTVYVAVPVSIIENAEMALN